MEPEALVNTDALVLIVLQLIPAPSLGTVLYPSYWMAGYIYDIIVH